MVFQWLILKLRVHKLNQYDFEMKEKLLALLVAKFIGVSEATLERIATKKAGSISDETQLQSVVDGIDFGVILQSEKDATITEANKKAIENYEKKHGIKDGKAVVVTPEDTPPAPTDIASIVAAAVSKAIEPLQSKVELFEKQKTSEQLNSIARAKLKEKSIPESFVDTINIESEDQVETFITGVETRYNSFIQEQINNGRYVDKPVYGKGGGEKTVEEYTKLMNGESTHSNAVVDLGLNSKDE